MILKFLHNKKRTLTIIAILLVFVICFFFLDFSMDAEIESQDDTRTIRMTYGNIKHVGYGNQMYSVLTVFTIAFLTDRQPQFYMPRVRNLIKEPMPNAFLKGEYARISTRRYKKRIYGRSDNVWKMKKDIKSIINTRVDYAEPVIFYSDIIAYYFEICSNPVYYDKLQMLNLTKPETIRDAKNALNNHKLNNEELIDKIYKIGIFNI